MSHVEALDFVEAKVNHLVPPENEKPAAYIVPPGEGETRRESVYEGHLVKIHDIRPVVGDLSLDREGLELVDHATAVRNFYDDDEVERVYYPEVEALIKSATGAEKVVVFDHTRRIEGDGTGNAMRAPVKIVHNDYTETSGPQRVRDLLGDEADEWLDHRFAVINVWRTIAGPVETMPLAVADATSMDAGDFIATDLVYEDRVGEIYDVGYNPRHRWMYAPHMHRDEAMLIKCYDSETDGRARFTAHTAFADPTSPGSAPPRESIEIRTLVLYPED